MNSHTVNTTVRMQVTFTLNSVLTDPTTVIGTVIDPTGVSTSYTVAGDTEMTNPSTGVYRIELIVGIEGIWEYRIVGTGVVNESAEGRFEVPVSSFVS